MHDEEVWRAVGFIFYYEDRAFVYVNGATAMLPRCDLSYPDRVELVREGLYRKLREGYGLGDSLAKREVALVIAPHSDWEKFQCPLMPPRLSESPTAYVSRVSFEQERVLLDELLEGRDPCKVDMYYQTVGLANINFLKHMFGRGEYQQPCIPCQAMVAAYRVLCHERQSDYFVMDSVFTLPDPGVRSVAV
jgi:hypothetical protein